MIGYSEAPVAWGLTRGMARILGVSLTTAVVDGWLSRPELAVLIDRCHACQQKQSCMNWLASAAQTPCLPVFCPNKQPLEALSFKN